jgi:hypothetical protein
VLVMVVMVVVVWPVAWISSLAVSFIRARFVGWILCQHADTGCFLVLDNRLSFSAILWLESVRSSVIGPHQPTSTGPVLALSNLCCALSLGDRDMFARPDVPLGRRGKIRDL